MTNSSFPQNHLYPRRLSKFRKLLQKGQTRLLGASTALLIGIPALALASTSESPDLQKSGQLEEITVTAQRRSENLQRVPVAVTAVGENELKEAGVTDASQLANVVSGLSFEIAGAEFEPHLRGIGTTSDGPGLENPVALYIDGVYYGPQSSIPRALFEASQISVLKGPQGTLFGRNATGGVIQIATRDPSEEFVGEFQTSLDNYMTTVNDAYVSGRLADDVTANIWGHYGYQANGWGHNQATGNDIDRLVSDVGFRSKVRWTPSAESSVLLNMDYLNRTDSQGLCLSPYPGTTPAVPGYKRTNKPWDFDDATDCLEWVKAGGISLTANQELAFAKLVNITAFREFSYSETFSTTLSPIPAEVLVAPDQGTQFTQEIQLVSPNSGNLTWAAGIYYFHSDNATDYASPGIPGSGLQIYFRGPFAPTPTSLGELDLHTHIIDNSVAGFGQTTYEFLPETRLTAGVRYTYEHKRFDGSEYGFLVDGTPLGSFPLPPVAPTLTVERPTWRLAVDHNFTADVLGYVSYNRGFKSGGYNGNDPTNQPYGPETLDAYEMGFKNELLDHRLRVNLGGFYYKYENIQVSRYISTEIIYNGAGANLYGLDFDGTARITDSLSLISGIEWLHSKFTAFPNAQYSSQIPGGGVALFTADARGNQLPFAPQLTFNLALNYVKTLPFGTIDLNVSNNYNNGYFTEASNFLRQRAYSLLATSAKWTNPAGKFSVKLWANNILDKAVFSFSAIQPTGYDVGYGGNAPRTYGLTLDFHF